MGRVRTKTVKKLARVIVEKYYSKLTLDFQTNKKITEDVASIPSKRLRNKIAGYMTHLMKRIGKGPVRGISLKLQEEERERRMEYVPERSEVNVDVIDVDSDTKKMLKTLGMGPLSVFKVVGDAHKHNGMVDFGTQPWWWCAATGRRVEYGPCGSVVDVDVVDAHSENQMLHQAVLAISSPLTPLTIDSILRRTLTNSYPPAIPPRIWAAAHHRIAAAAAGGAPAWPERRLCKAPPATLGGPPTFGGLRAGFLESPTGGLGVPRVGGLGVPRQPGSLGSLQSSCGCGHPTHP